MLSKTGQLSQRSTKQLRKKSMLVQTHATKRRASGEKMVNLRHAGPQIIVTPFFFVGSRHSLPLGVACHQTPSCAQRAGKLTRKRPSKQRTFQVGVHYLERMYYEKYIHTQKRPPVRDITGCVEVFAAVSGKKTRVYVQSTNDAEETQTYITIYPVL